MPATASSAAWTRPSWRTVSIWQRRWCWTCAVARQARQRSPAPCPTPNSTSTFPYRNETLHRHRCVADRARDILVRLGFGVEGRWSEDERLTVSVPSNRPDIEGKADIVEEIMRINGVNEIAPQPLPALTSVGTKTLTTGQTRTRDTRRTLAARGMSEAVLYSFIPHTHAEAFGGGAEALTLANPIAADMSDMRPSLLPSLLAAAARNVARGIGDLAMFEVSHVYSGDKPEDQHRAASGIRRGTARLETVGRNWMARRNRSVGSMRRKTRSPFSAPAAWTPSKVQVGSRWAGLVPPRSLRHAETRPENHAGPFRRIAPGNAGTARSRPVRFAASKSCSTPSPHRKRRARPARAR